MPYSEYKKIWKKNCIFGRFSSITADPLVISKRNFNTAEFLTRCSKWDALRYRTFSQKCGRAVFLCPTQGKKRFEKKNASLVVFHRLWLTRWLYQNEILTQQSFWPGTQNEMLQGAVRSVEIAGAPVFLCPIQSKKLFEKKLHLWLFFIDYGWPTGYIKTKF